MPKNKKKTKKKHSRRASVSKLSYPVDVRSEKDIPTFLNALKSKNLTIVMVYAPWCGFCQQFMPIFDKLARNPKNTVCPVKIHHEMLPHVNKATNSSLSVRGYPSVLLLDSNAKPLTEVQHDEPEKLKSLMENAGTIAGKVNIGNKTISYDPNESPVELSSSNMNSYPESESESESESDEFNIASISSPRTLKLATPPTPDSEEPNVEPVKVGGSLMSIMGKTAYTLAPAAILLAAASRIMKTRKRKGTKRRQTGKQRQTGGKQRQTGKRRRR